MFEHAFACTGDATAGVQEDSATGAAVAWFSKLSDSAMWDTSSTPSSSRRIWCPGAPIPAHLDGSLPGDYGFDPLNLGADPAALKWCAPVGLSLAWICLFMIPFHAIKLQIPDRCAILQVHPSRADPRSICNGCCSRRADSNSAWISSMV